MITENVNWEKASSRRPKACSPGSELEAGDGRKGPFPVFCASHPGLDQSTHLGRRPGISHIDLGLVVALRQDGYTSPSTHT